MTKVISKTLKSELEAALIIILLSISLFFLPNHTIDPWNIVNPQKLVIIFLLIASMQYAGYFSIRLLGHKIGTALVGFLGGFVSSTIVFVILSKKYKEESKFLYSTVAAAILATVSMLMAFLIIIFSFSSDLFKIFLYPVLFMIVISLFSVLLLTRKEDNGHLGLETINPFDLKSSLTLAFLLFSILILINGSITYNAAHNAILISFLSGLFDLHSISIAIGTLYVEKKLFLPDSKSFLSIALSAAFISKIAIACFFARNRFALFTSLYLCVLLIITLSGFVLKF